MPDLLTQSRYACATSGWVEFQETVGDYRWLSSTTLIYRVREVSDGSWRLRELDLSSGRKRAIDVSSWSKDRIYTPWDSVVSPDGKLIRWTTTAGGKSEWVVTDLRGRKLGSWTPHAWRHTLDSEEEQSLAQWSADGKSITESLYRFGPPGKARLEVWKRNVARLGVETAFKPLVSPDNESDWCEAFEDGRGGFVWVPEPLVSSPSSIGEVIFWRPNEQNSFRIAKTSLGTSAARASGQVSPDVRQILWQTTADNDRRTTLIVTNIDGSNRRVLGQMRFAGTGNSTSQEFGGVSWVPGGKSVSFVWQRKLYLVPVPGAGSH